MTGKQICTGLLFTAFLLNGCAGKQSADPNFRIVLTDMSASEKQQFIEEQLSETIAQTELLEGNKTRAVELLRNGEADCGYGLISADDAVHYGILKSDVVKRREMLLVSDKRLISSSDLDGLVVGYPDDLDDEFVQYLRSSISNLELHAYLSTEQLEKDLKSGLLDLAAAETDTAFQILEAEPQLWQISQPIGAPTLEYRFFACTQEALNLAETIGKEN